MTPLIKLAICVILWMGKFTQRNFNRVWYLDFFRQSSSDQNKRKKDEVYDFEKNYAGFGKLRINSVQLKLGRIKLIRA